MKRIVSILLIFFVSALILNSFLASIMYEKTKCISINRKDLNIRLDDTTTLKNDTINFKIDTVNIINPKDKIIKEEDIHHATWYRTNGTRVHREYPTAAYNRFPKGTKLLVTNIKTGDTCIVEVTDRMGNKNKNKIDLSHSAFGKIGNHSSGRIRVKVQKLK
jgi:rare lipoprotein A (peptidoglycan hydrolase)